MSAQHTPGPWHVLPASSKTCNLGVYNHDGALIAAIGATEITVRRRTADADLIAAAPEMLAELRLRMDRDYNPFEPANQSAGYRRLEALIAKATGAAS